MPLIDGSRRRRPRGRIAPEQRHPHHVRWQKFTGEELDKEFNTLLKPLMGDIKTTDTTDKPFSITFRRKPIEIHFDKQTVTVTLRLEFTSATRIRRHGHDRCLQTHQDAKGLVADRVGDLKIFPPGFVQGERQTQGPSSAAKAPGEKFGRV